MSGSGKSYWSKKIESRGFCRYSCDDLIAEKLGSKIHKTGNSTQDLAKWMGTPNSKDYLEAEKLYLKMEEEVVKGICEELEDSVSKEKPIIVDTTGSLIYLKRNLLDRLRKQVVTVHLNLPAYEHEELLAAYLLDPKPLIWKGIFNPIENENPNRTIKRCFGELLSFRKELYKLISDCVLDYSFHHDAKTGVTEFLEIVSSNSKNNLL